MANDNFVSEKGRETETENDNSGFLTQDHAVHRASCVHFSKTVYSDF